MASKKILDERMEGGGKMRSSRNISGSRKGSGMKSDGTSSTSSSDESLYNERADEDYKERADKDLVKRRAESVEYCSTLARPDREVSAQEIRVNLIIRKSKATTLTHVLVMGSPCMLFHPLRCPYPDNERLEGCESFRAHAPQYLKEHLEAKHKLVHVQINLSCPCPPACNGKPQGCEVVKYDPMDGILEYHIKKKHRVYFNKMGASLCYQNEEEDNLEDVPEEDIKYIKHLDSWKKLPDWTRECSQLWPSQRLPEKAIVHAIVKNKKVLYTCKIRPCRGTMAVAKWVMCNHLDVHDDRVGNQAQYYERCPVQKCGLLMHWSEKKMPLHIRAMHPELLDGPASITERATAELAKLVQQIKGKVIGQAITDATTTEDNADGTKPHYLYNYFCPVQDCKECYAERDHLIWHVRADHQKEWNMTPEGAERTSANWVPTRHNCSF